MLYIAEILYLGRHFLEQKDFQDFARKVEQGSNLLSITATAIATCYFLSGKVQTDLTWSVTAIGTVKLKITAMTCKIDLWHSASFIMHLAMCNSQR